MSNYNKNPLYLYSITITIVLITVAFFFFDEVLLEKSGIKGHLEEENDYVF